MVYAHRHNIGSKFSGKTALATPAAAKSISDKCSLCDALHHTFFEEFTPVFQPLLPVGVNNYQYLSFPAFSIKLIKASGRAPPVKLVC